MYLNVPYDEKDYAKLKGARWDSKKSKWYVPEGVSPMAFHRWWSFAPKPSKPLPKLPRWALRRDD